MPHDEPAGPAAGWRLQLLVEGCLDGLDHHVTVHALTGHQRVGNVLGNICKNSPPGTFFADVGAILVQPHFL